MENKALLFSVADNGPGIPGPNQHGVFEQFWRGEQNNAAISGLGLAIVRQAAKRLDASLTLEAGIGGKGCRFSLRIPNNEPNEPNEPLKI